MRASAVATLFSLAAGASAFTVGGPAIVSRPVSVSRFLSPLDPKSFMGKLAQCNQCG